MKINVKQSDCRFIVKPEDRIVICRLDRLNGHPLKRCVSEFARDCTESSNVTFYLFGSKADSVEMPKSFTGIARCSVDDEWDEEKGKKIAFLRVKEKFYTSLFKRANTYIKYCDQATDMLSEHFNELGRAVSDNLKALRDEVLPGKEEE